MKTIQFKNVYVHSYGAAGGPMEKQGLLGSHLDVAFDDVYCGEKTYEMAERKLLSCAIEAMLKNGDLKAEDIDCYVGSDLINQLGTAHYFMKHIAQSFLGVYAACSASTLASAICGMMIDAGYAEKACAFVSSHNATAERQFRYPNEYGVQKPDTTTFTVTGAGAICFSRQKSEIRLVSATIGKVVDFGFKNVNDMGSAMAPAAFDTIMTHFKNTNTSFKDYDLVVTGDLSKVGLTVLFDLFENEGIDTDKRLADCGLIVYNLMDQPVFSGGSGCACSALGTIASLFPKIKEGNIHRVLVAATGALLSPVLVQQKDSIPCISHCVVYERVSV
ncbi:MAG: stage V sporulation protein AD [Erysipelotrichaceae bacterium]|nr:stage V sporulation protein AD [Erysipelotrichaceae bacterium]